MKSIIIIFLISLSTFSYGQTNSSTSKITGTYKGRWTSDLTLILNDNKTFTSVIEKNDLFDKSEFKGTWKISADTLLLYSRRKISAKYLISVDTLSEIQIEKTEDGLNTFIRQKK